MKNFNVITIGNALLDVFLSIQEHNIFTQINQADHTLCFKYGEKIHVEDCEFLLGGNACNVAVGLSRLGLSTVLCAEIGDDEFSQKIIHSLSKETLDTSLLMQTAGAASSFAVGIGYGGERTLFVEHVARKHDFHFDDVVAEWIYLTSLGEEWRQAYSRVLDYVKSHNRKLAFSPGTHQFEEEGHRGINEILPLTDILFVNREEAEKVISNKKKVISIKELLIELQKLGPKVVSITDGQNGSYAMDTNGHTYSLAVFPCKVIEKTGAGDAYASGFLSAVIGGGSIKEAMRWGAVNAAAVIEKIGAQQGLLKREEIVKKLEGNSAFITKTM